MYSHAAWNQKSVIYIVKTLSAHFMYISAECICVYTQFTFSWHYCLNRKESNCLSVVRRSPTQVNSLIRGHYIRHCQHTHNAPLRHCSTHLDHLLSSGMGNGIAGVIVNLFNSCSTGIRRGSPSKPSQLSCRDVSVETASEAYRVLAHSDNYRGMIFNCICEGCN